MGTRNELKDRYESVMHRVRESGERGGKRASDLIVVAVTKTATPQQIRKLVELGHRDFGENRVQQLEQRVAIIDESISRRKLVGGGESHDAGGVRWHMIGHLQRNKVKAVLPLVKLVHGVDSLRLAEEVQAHASRMDTEVDVLLQVNVSGEVSKHGLAAAAIPHLAEQMQTMANVRVRGLMTMAPYEDDPESARPHFQRCAELFEEVRGSGRVGQNFNVLSMGMSGDFEVAIECGANVVRIGRAIFGEEK